MISQDKILCLISLSNLTTMTTSKKLGKKSLPQFEVNKKLFLRIMHPRLIVFSFLQIDIFKLSEIFYTYTWGKVKVVLTLFTDKLNF